MQKIDKEKILNELRENKLFQAALSQTNTEAEKKEIEEKTSEFLLSLLEFVEKT